VGQWDCTDSVIYPHGLPDSTVAVNRENQKACTPSKTAHEIRTEARYPQAALPTKAAIVVRFSRQNANAYRQPII